MKFRSTYDPRIPGYFIERQEPGTEWDYISGTYSFTKWGSLFDLWNVVRKHRRSLLGITVIKEVEV